MIALTKFPGYVLRRASSATLAELNRRLAPLALRHADVAFLLLVASSPGITQSEAGRVLDILRANMVPFVARLEARGLVERRPVDGRSRALRLTDKGLALQSKARKLVDAFEASLLARVPVNMRPMVLPILMALWNGPGHDHAG